MLLIRFVVGVSCGGVMLGCIDVYFAGVNCMCYHYGNVAGYCILCIEVLLPIGPDV